MIDFIFEKICDNNLIDSEQDKVDLLINLQPEVTALRKAYLKYPIFDLDYSINATQEAYLLAYFPHYTLPIDVILSENFAENKFPTESINITLIGGGPCPEIIAIIKYLKVKKNLPKKINIYLLDKYASAWEYSLQIIKPYIDSISDNSEVIINKIDFELSSNFDHNVLSKYLKITNILTVQNILNELPENHHSGIKKFLQLISSSENKFLTIITELYGQNKPPKINSIFQNFINNNDFIIHENFNNNEAKRISKTFKTKLVYNHLLNGKDYLIPRKHCKFRFFSFINNSKLIVKTNNEIRLFDEIGLSEIINSFAYINEDEDLKNQTFIGVDFGTSTSYAVIGSFKDNKIFSFEDVTFSQKGYLSGNREDNKLKTSIAFHNNKIYCGEGANSFSRGNLAIVNQNYWQNFKLDLSNDEDIFLYSKHPKISNSESASKVFLNYISNFINEKIKTLSYVSSHNYMLSIPSSFNYKQRQKYIKLINEIGIDSGLKEMIDEPNAALLSYLNDNKIPFKNGVSNIMVFDYGAGTCDISLVKIYNSISGIQMSNLAVSEFSKIGGNFLNTQITRKFLIKQILDQADISENISGLIDEITPRLESKAEIMKEALCKKANLNDRNIVTKNRIIFKNRIYNLELNTNELKEVSKYCFNKNERLYAEQKSIYSSLDKTLSKAKIKYDAVNLVIFIGGASKNPFIRNEVKDLFKNSEFDFPQSNQTQNQSRIAQGSAIYGYLLKKTLSPIIQPISLDRIDIAFANNKIINTFIPGLQLPTESKLIEIHFSKEAIISDRIEIPFLLNGKHVLISEFNFDSNWHKSLPQEDKLTFNLSVYINENNQIMTRIQSLSNEHLIISGIIKETRSNQLIFKNFINQSIHNNKVNIQDVIDLTYLYSEIMDYQKGIELINSILNKNIIDKSSNYYDLLILRLADIYTEMFDINSASKIISGVVSDNNENILTINKLNYLIAKIAYEKNDIKKLEEVFIDKNSSNIQLTFLWGMYLKNSIGIESDYKKFYKLALDQIYLKKEDNSIKNIQLTKYIIDELGITEEKYLSFHITMLLNKFIERPLLINYKN